MFSTNYVCPVCGKELPTLEDLQTDFNTCMANRKKLKDLISMRDAINKAAATHNRLSENLKDQYTPSYVTVAITDKPVHTLNDLAQSILNGECSVE